MTTPHTTRLNFSPVRKKSQTADNNDMRGRILEFDGARGLAILMIMAFQFIWFPLLLGVEFGHTNGLLVRGFQNFMLSGWTGANLFFVLSGFLITNILLEAKKEKHSLWRFYGRRALRLFPVYFLLLTASLIFLNRVYPQPLLETANPQHPMWTWTFLSNIFVILTSWQSLPLPLQHLWAIAIEVQFLAIWPLVMWLVGPRKGLWACVAIILGSLSLRTVLVNNDMQTVAYLLLPCRLESFAWGALIPLLKTETRYRRVLEKYSRQVIGGCAVVLAVLFLWRKGLHQSDAWALTLGFTALDIFFATCIYLCTAFPRWVRFIGWAPLPWIGRHSYSLFLLHQPICVWLITSGLLEANAPGFMNEYAIFKMLYYFLTSLAVTMLAAYSVWHLYEKHFLKLKDKMGKQPVVRRATAKARKAA